MTNRLDQTFAALKAQGRKALVTYSMAGDPNPVTSLAVLHELAKSADVLEIGMPFTDPMADGPAIQAAGLRALDQGMSVRATFELVQQFRSKNSDTPIVLMGYFNPVLTYGIEKFMSDCKDIGIDGLIIVDIPPEEGIEIVPKAQQNDIRFIRLLTPTTDAARLQTVLKDASGFLYYVSIAGITGTASADPAKVGKHIAEIKKGTDLPIVAGFGIKTPEDARAMSAIADGVVVGSALVQTVAENLNDPALPAKIGAQAAALAAVLGSTKNAA
jgi:tryptophan synthase alpha chain